MTKFLLLTRHDSELDVPPMDQWDPADVKAHLDYLTQINDELASNGELVEMQALVAPELAKTVSADGLSRPVITDGPFPETKEVLAGYQMLDVESEERAVEIAARVSSAPGPDGVPLRQRIEVRQVMWTRSDHV
jgi:hypothetical protein